MNAVDFNKKQLTDGKLTVEHITELVRYWQENHSLVVDGMAGPKTLASIAPPVTPKDLLVETGLLAINKANHYWSLDIYDPKSVDNSEIAKASKLAISEMIHAGLGWNWEPFYTGDGDFEWCGAFAARCWRGIKPELRKTYFASTYRLDRYARYQSVNGEKNTGTGRLIASLDENSKPEDLPFAPRAGDIITIGPKGSGYGKHICLVERVEGNKVFTYEGNGTGQGPNGERQQGVVRATRYIGNSAGNDWHVRRWIRPSVEDLITT